MSLLRQRAMSTSAGSTVRARNPAFARAWLWSASNCDSDWELNEPASQAATVPGAAKTPDVPTATASVAMRASRRVRRAAGRSTGAGTRDGDEADIGLRWFVVSDRLPV